MKTKINQNIFKKFPILKTDRLLLRGFERQDMQALYQLKSNASVMEFMDAPKLKSLEDAQKMIDIYQNDFKEKKGINWAITEQSSNNFMGYFSFWRIIKEHCRAEIGYALHPDYWRKGHMKEAAQAAIGFSFNKLDLHSIEANVNPENEPSKRLLLKLGFQQEAYFRENYLFDGRFTDSAIFCLLNRVNN